MLPSQATLPILVVEDDADSVVLLKHAFCKAEVANPIRALESCELAVAYLSGAAPFEDRAKNPIPGIILIDLRLSYSSGLELVTWIRHHPKLKHLVTIVISASEDPNQIRSVYETGANSYIVKPVSLEQLIEVARSIKNFWLTMTRLPACSVSMP